MSHVYAVFKYNTTDGSDELDSVFYEFSKAQNHAQVMNILRDGKGYIYKAYADEIKLDPFPTVRG